ncbi:MAG: tetratricopeptide repeat protein, partial [Gammaproteobacteria bacterium]|nr:tetratricopeptide repeat protein [Gammaproteobacteria bacterium]
MKRLAAIFCLLFLLAIAFPLYAAPLTQTDIAILNLTNDSEETICFVHISLVTADSWGDDWLSEDETIEPDQARNFTIKPDIYDVLLLDCDGEMLLNEPNLSITDRSNLSFADFDPCESLNQAGMSLVWKEKYLDALEPFHQAITCYQETGNQIQESGNLNNIGLIYTILDQHETALDYYQQSLIISREIGNQIGEGRTLDNIGSIYSTLGQYEAALDIYQQSLSIKQGIDDRVGEGTALTGIGIIYSDLGEYETALDYYQHSLTIRQEIDDRSGEGTTLNNIGVVYARSGQYEQALDYYEQALTISQEIGDRSGEGTTLIGIGGIYAGLSQYEMALDYYQQSLTILKEIGDRVGEGTTLNNIGVVYAELGRYEAALDIYQQSLIISQEIGDQAREGHTLNNIGGIYGRLGQYEAALDYSRKSLTIRQEIGDRDGEATTLNTIGLIYSDLGEYETALDYYQQSLIISQKIGDQAGEGATLNNIGLVYNSLGEYEMALDYYQQSLTINQEIGDRAVEGKTLNNIGLIYANWDQYETALDYYQQSLTISQEVGDQAGEGVILNNIGFNYANLGQNETALDYYQQAIEILDTVRGQAGSEQGRAEFISKYVHLYHRTIDLFHQQGQTEEAFFTTERGRARAFLDSLATGEVRLSDQDSAKLLRQEQEHYAQQQAIRFELAEAKANTPERVADLEQQLAQAEAAYEDVQAAIAARGAELASLVPSRSATTVLGVDQVQPLLAENTTLLTYYVLEDKLLALILTANSFETVALALDPTELTQQITTFRDFANVTAAYPGSAVALYDMLIAPLKDKLTTPHLAIIPHQSLHYLPFAALTNGDRYLIDDYTLTVLPSASALPFILENAEEQGSGGAGEQTDTTSAPLPPSAPALILGNPTTADYDTVASLATTREGFGSLPYAEKEAKTIAKLFGVEPLIGEAATETAVREQVS